MKKQNRPREETLYRGIPIRAVKRLPRPKLLLPNEHGAWGIFAVSFLVGWLTAPELSWRPLLLLPAAIGAFLTRYPVGLYFKKRRVTQALSIPLTREKGWFWIYFLLTATVSLPLFYPLGWWWILAFGGISLAVFGLHLHAVVRRKERTLFSEVSAMTGLTALAPAASFAAVPRLLWEPLAIWALLALFCLQRTIAIRRRVAQRKEKPADIRSLGKRELVYAFLFAAIISAIARVYYYV